MFKALLLENKDSEFSARIQNLDDSRLPAADVLVRVEYSSLNYKDALAITNKGPVVRAWPMIPGIDGAGTVLESSHAKWRPGDRFVSTGWDTGVAHWGCLAERARLMGDWLVQLPAAFSARQAMSIGTAGVTAMLCVLALERHGLKPGDGDVLVTGATGGVGGLATLLLSRLGYRVIAATGKPDEETYLKNLGAAAIMDRAGLSVPGKPLQKERWAGVVDVLGGISLANACAQTRYGGVVAACGLAQGADFPSTVMPFILRGVTLAGIDSAMAPLSLRRKVWERLARDLDLALLEPMIDELKLEGVVERAAELIAGRVRGRGVVRIC